VAGLLVFGGIGNINRINFIARLKLQQLSSKVRLLGVPFPGCGSDSICTFIRVFLRMRWVIHVNL
jgi:hypothetical protein